MSELVWIHRFNENELGLGARGAFCLVPVEARKIFFPDRDFENNPDINETINLVFQKDQKPYNVTYTKPPSKTEHRLYIAGMKGDIGQMGSNRIITPGKIGCFYRKEDILYFSVAQEESAYDDLLKKFPSRGKDNNVVTRTVFESANCESKIETNHKNLLDDFIEWFIKLPTESHNYFINSFQSKRLKLKEALEEYQQVYTSEFGISVFDVDLDDIEKFIQNLESNLYTNKGSFHDFSDTISNHMPRAILGRNNYIKFLKKHYTDKNLELDISLFYYSCEESGLIYSKELITRFVSSLITKPFVILTGLSGSGKTKLAEAFSMWISRSEKQYCMVSVGADWTNREPILGYPNALVKGDYISPDCGALDLIIRARKDENQPCFLILDEMNMSHVERYFADFLSAMESTEGTISLHPGKDDCDVPATIKLPKNLFIIGTVNIDETTYMFSPKVLDRANVIEFRVDKEDMRQYFEEPKELDMDVLKSSGASMAEDFVKKSNKKGKITNKLEEILMPFFIKLQEVGAEFGYRTASEMSRFICICTELSDRLDSDMMSKDEIIDAAIMQKLLPKLHGSRNKIKVVLEALSELCLEVQPKDSFSFNDENNVKYKLSYEKLKRMHQRVMSDGFTSFAEA